MKTAKVTEVTNVRKWEGNGNTIYYHSIVLDNGDRGSIGKKTEGAIKVGDTLNYTIDGDKIKAVPAQNGFGGGFKGGAKGSSASFALAYAKDVMVAAMPLHPEVPVSQWVDVAITAAGKFQKFLKENE